MNRKILIIGDKYYPKPFANFVCVSNVFSEGNGNKCSVDIMCFKDKENKKIRKEGESVTIIPYRPDFRNSIFVKIGESKGLKKILFKIIGKMLSFIGIIFNLFQLPRKTIVAEKRLQKNFLKQINRENYDAVISVLSPVVSCISILNLKKRGLIKCKWILYDLDTLDTEINKYHLCRLYKKTNYQSPWYKKFLMYCDHFVLMISRSDLLEKYSEYRSKMVLSDLPMLVSDCFLENSNLEKKENKNFYSFAYLGTMDGYHYKYNDIISLFAKANFRKPVKMFFYTKGINIVLPKTIGEGKQIFSRGFVERKEAIQIENDTDCLISVKYSNQISAKIFEYMNLNKKIIHISGCLNDPNVDYLLKYPNALILKASELGKNDFVTKLNDFLDMPIYDFDVKNTFKMNIPSYTYNLMMGLIYGDK